ncbi:MAG: carbon storage regulator CsrA [Dissulfurimicrobium sp.]|uniref:carbon storage regulator CsrA n=1 Tax=Dissulfurimicrobium TaxID=1769732 RepID=UPI001EDC5952|nr:carbon storage regulator CsrA [Dissulfurimicrobium hydrothermale]UKL13709.1 carbon storage regulator CsrA [Dissulfurimicrobium hydrothermale]
MLILTRKAGEKIRIGAEIEVTVLDVNGRQVRIGISAPPGLSILREEVFRRIQEENLKAAGSAAAPEDLDKIVFKTRS